MDVISRPMDPSYRTVTPRWVTVHTDIGPFIGRTGRAVAEDDKLVWIEFNPGGSYPPCDRPGVYGIHREYVRDETRWHSITRRVRTILRLES